MNRKQKQNIHHANLNVNLMVEDVIQIKSRIIKNANVSAKILKRRSYFRKDYVWNLTTYTYENGKYLESIIAESVTACDEIIEMTKTIPTKTVTTKTIPVKILPTNFHEKRQPVK